LHTTFLRVQEEPQRASYLQLVEVEEGCSGSGLKAREHVGWVFGIHGAVKE